MGYFLKLSQNIWTLPALWPWGFFGGQAPVFGSVTQSWFPGHQMGCEWVTPEYLQSQSIKFDATAELGKYFLLFFGLWENLVFCFWNLLTFTWSMKCRPRFKWVNLRFFGGSWGIDNKNPITTNNKSKTKCQKYQQFHGCCTWNVTPRTFSVVAINLCFDTVVRR